MNNINKDIEILKEFIEYSQNMINDMEYEKPVDVTIYQKEVTAIENVLSELDTKDKIIDCMANKFYELYKIYPRNNRQIF